DTKTRTNLNRGIESTTTVCRNEWKYVADLVLDLDPALPAVDCHPGEMNQAILNLVINAAHAIGDIVKEGNAKGRITIRTRQVEDGVQIEVEDTGPGIPDAIRPHIFDPFFTTKPVGKGTGQGLAIVHSVVVEKHGGSIEVQTEPGRGTKFILRLPMGGGMRYEIPGSVRR
ncbi:MAG TPA: ATP-binding protein, partial [Holophaga sp.]|nr:ATP-binding protein [Holophaga sp.]